MEKLGIIFFATLIALFGWYGFTLSTLPEPPAIDHFVSDEVDLDFEINKLSMSEIELQLVNAGSEMFVHFTTTDDWAKGRPGLAVSSMRKQSNFGNKGMTPAAYQAENPGNKDFGQFMKDSKGKDVKTYKLRHQLAEGDDGNLYMKMMYVGQKIPLIQVLEFDHPVDVPADLCGRFGDIKGITFNAGTYYLDRKIGGFWLPVTVTN